MNKIGKINLSFRSVSLLVMFCMLFQFTSATALAAGPASRESSVTNDVQVLKHPLLTSQTIEQRSPEMRAEAGWPLMNEGFEGTFPQGAWSSVDKDGATNGEYYWGPNSHIKAAGLKSAWPAAAGANAVDPSASFYPNNVDTWMIYGPINLALYNSVTFQFKYWNQSELDADYFGWYTSPDGITYTGTKVSGDSAGWVTQTIDLSPLYGDTSVWIAFAFTSNAANGDDGTFIDAISLVTDNAFSSNFNTESSGWGKVSGAWSLSNSSFTTRGITGKVSSIVQAGTYTALNYEAKIKRLGCSTCANRLYVRGTHKPTDSYNDWISSYVFQYANDKYFSVWKTGNGTQALKYWTYYPGIKSGWNVLRVTAKGPTLKFYINGALVWAQNDRGLSSGRVGIGMYRDYYSANNSFSVDWAKLDLSITATAAAEENEIISSDVGETIANWNNPDQSPPAP